MRALLITENFPPARGGSGRWLFELYRRFANGEDSIAAGDHPGHVEFDRTHSLEIHRINLHLPQWGLRSAAGLTGYTRAIRKLSRMVAAERPKVLHAARVLPEGWMALLLARWHGLPYICDVHGEDIEMSLRSRELRWMTQRVLNGARLIIASSYNSRRLLVERWRIRDEKIKVLHPGADTRYFVPSARDDAARLAFGWEGRAVVLTVGRLQTRKGQDMLIRALPILKKAVPNVLYVVVGDGNDRERLAELAIENKVRDAVQFRYDCDDNELLSCYQQCDLFALPNREINGDIEGFGIVLVEAQACGKPVIAGDSGGTRETLSVGKTGLIVDCTRPEPLSQAIIELLSNRERCQAMGRAARQWAVEGFDWEATALRADAALQMLADDVTIGPGALRTNPPFHEFEQSSFSGQKI